VREANPYVIMGINSASNVEEFQQNWSTRRGIEAVRAGRLLYIESEALQRPTVRTLDSIARLCVELDQVRLRNQLIAASEAYSLSTGPLAASPAVPSGDMLQRPMTSVERDVAAVLASAYAVGKNDAPAAEAKPAPSAPEATQRVPAPRPAAEPSPGPASTPPVALAAAPAMARELSAPPARGSPAAYTQVSRYGDLYFVSGQIALDPATGRFDGAAKIGAQTLGALENVRQALEAERLTMANVVSTTVYLRSINDLDAMDEAWQSAFRTRLPARTVVETPNLPRGALVQISVVAGR
jgi:2-iminobutanoate/2-iminopropanoate deaminase